MAYSAITKPSLHMNTKLYTGTGASHAITGVGFQPDWVWLKSRSYADNHTVFDAPRGVTKRIFSNLDQAEATEAQSLKTFDSDGFTLGTDTLANGGSGKTYAAWNWKANGAGSSNSDGSITATVSANATAGFSIVKYTGAGGTQTVGHGLGAIPEVVMVKRLDSANGWIVWNKYLQGNNKYLILNTTAAQATNSTFFQETPPTSSVFYVGNDAGINGGSNTYVAYCFKSIKGFSKHGYYNGNGNTDGNFVYTGFKPKLVIIKVAYASAGSDFVNHWFMFDNELNGYNESNEYLKSDADEAISSGTNRINFLSNGFKCRTTNDSVNSASGVYTYMAWADEPLVANVGASIPTTAR
jgi:hypothetical protein